MKRCPPGSTQISKGKYITTLDTGKKCFSKVINNIHLSKNKSSIPNFGTYSVILSNSYNNRFKLRKALKKKFSPSQIKSRKVLSNRITASESKVTQLNLKNNTNIIIKESLFDISLLNEAHIYRMVNNLVYKKVCPFFFTSVRLPKIETINGKKHITQYMETSNVLGTFSNMSKQIPIVKLKHLFFQLWYSLSCLHQLGIAHRDMHFGNIFVIKSKHTAIKYITHHGTFYVPTAGYEVRIYDFDRSFKSNINTNEKWNKISKITIPDPWTSKYGTEKKHQYRFDLFKLVYYFTFRNINLFTPNMSYKYSLDSLGRTHDRTYPYINMVDQFSSYRQPQPTTYTCNMMKLSPSDKMYK